MTVEEIKEFCKNEGYRKLMLGNKMSYGCYPSTNLDKIKTAWTLQPQKIHDSFMSCYSGYLSSNKHLIKETGWKYYVSYPFIPEWFPELVEEFNEFYDNLKIEILESKDVYLKFIKKTSRTWDYNKNKEINVERFEMNFDEKEGHKKVCIPLVRFDYADDYDPVIKYYFNYSLVILIRMLSIPERFTDPFFTPSGSKMRYLVKVNNKNRGYRSFSDSKITLKGLKLLDDVELLNSNVNKVYFPEKRIFSYVKQTDFFNVITGGDYIKYYSWNKKPQVKERNKPQVKKETYLNDNIDYMPVEGCDCGQCEKLRKQGKKDQIKEV